MREDKWPTSVLMAAVEILEGLRLPYRAKEKIGWRLVKMALANQEAWNYPVDAQSALWEVVVNYIGVSADEWNSTENCKNMQERQGRDVAAP